MQVSQTINPYLEKILSQLLDDSINNSLNLCSTTSKVLTGFDNKEAYHLLEMIQYGYPTVNAYIIAENTSGESAYITAREIASLETKQSGSLYILPADDNMNLDCLESLELMQITHEKLQTSLIETLKATISNEIQQTIEEDVIACIDYLRGEPLPYKCIIDYFSTLEETGYTETNIGNYLYLLEAIPDAHLLSDKEQTRARLRTNLKCVKVLIQHERTLYDRILELPIKKHSIQRYLVDFFRNEADIKSANKLVNTIASYYESLNFMHWDILEDDLTRIALPTEHVTPEYDLLIGNNSPTSQFGLIGESISGRKVAIDLSGTNTISLFGVQGGGKSYTIGSIAEMVIKQFSHVSELPSPLAGVIFHYSESMDYEPEFTSMIHPNDKEKELEKLKRRYGADPNKLDDVVILCPKDKMVEKQLEYPSVQVKPISFNPTELNVKDWMFMLGALGSNANYVRQLKAIAKQHRKNITTEAIKKDVLASPLFTEFERGLALQKLDFADEYIDDNSLLRNLLIPGRLIIVDLRDEFIDKDEALGLFVIILNIFSGVQKIDGKHFNKFIVFDEAHKYMDNKDLTSNIVTAIREMRHKGVNIMIASQDPPSLPTEIIELSSIVMLHKFNSPHWLTHIKNALTQLEILSPQDLNVLNPGEGYLWATKATEKGITHKPLKITARPRVTKHGGATLQASGEK
ncbi:ATP-binding protein [Fulvivirga sediminis]|uniref:ATP-binding protein n=1 Tax=Fulvivirga sediminis TaxID=2803949 RepID=A0A937F9W9_9BACT|nr:ATP-binding protein [Fulvivirga sediminis]MBL3657682.1 ATP-binding protein [Fulvivirga sediminis]